MLGLCLAQKGSSLPVIRGRLAPWSDTLPLRELVQAASPTTFGWLSLLMYQTCAPPGQDWVGRSKDEQHFPGWSFAPFCLLDPKHHPQDVALPDQMAKNRFGFIAQKGKMSYVLGRYFEIDFPKSCHPVILTALKWDSVRAPALSGWSVIRLASHKSPFMKGLLA